MLYPGILIRLILSHLIFDFLFQSDKWVNDKYEKKVKSLYLYLHCFMQGLAAYLLVFDLKNYYIFIIIFITHLLIDIFKIYSGSGIISFLADQFMHLIVIFCLWIYFYVDSVYIYEFMKIYSDKILIISMGFFIITFPLPVIINMLLQKWEEHIKDNDSLENAGKWIGILERILAMIFILIGQYAGIGFLIAAKSIFRFGDIREGNDRKLTEYFLIGSLISYTSVMITGGIIKYLLIVL